jgi:hypothetical protein
LLFANNCIGFGNKDVMIQPPQHGRFVLPFDGRQGGWGANSETGLCAGFVI